MKRMLGFTLAPFLAVMVVLLGVGAVQAYTIPDMYVGWNFHDAWGVIGDPEIFDIYGMDVTFSNGLIGVTIYTNFKPDPSDPRTRGADYGDLFISTDGWNPFDPYKSSTTYHQHDYYRYGEKWEYVFDTSAERLYQLPKYSTEDSNAADFITNYITLAKSSDGVTRRDGQEILYVGGGTEINDSSFVDLSHAGYQGYIYFGIELASLGEISDYIGLKWGADCANDEIEGKVRAPVPEPATMLLLGFGLIGLAGFGRKRIFNK